MAHVILLVVSAICVKITPMETTVKFVKSGIMAMQLKQKTVRVGIWCKC